MIAGGTVYEVGQLENEGGALGFVIHREDNSYITVKGLTPDEVRAAASLLFGPASLILSAGAPP